MCKSLTTLYQTVNPRISVVIITRDRAELLRDSIQSVLHQTMGNFELIIVDDGSQDNTAEIVESFSDNRIYFARPILVYHLQEILLLSSQGPNGL